MGGQEWFCHLVGNDEIDQIANRNKQGDGGYPVEEGRDSFCDGERIAFRWLVRYLFLLAYADAHCSVSFWLGLGGA